MGEYWSGFDFTIKKRTRKRDTGQHKRRPVVVLGDIGVNGIGDLAAAIEVICSTAFCPIYFIH